jgi:hypothetical protein
VPGPRDAINSDEDRHYNAAGLRELGDRMWTAYRTMCADDLARFRAAGVGEGR